MGVNQHHSSLTAKSYVNLEQLLFGPYGVLEVLFVCFIFVNHSDDHGTEL